MNNSQTKERVNIVKTLWSIYRRDVGLDGEIYLELKEEGVDQDSILTAIKKHHEERKENLEVWRNLRKESLR